LLLESLASLLHLAGRVGRATQKPGDDISGGVEVRTGTIDFFCSTGQVTEFKELI
jgi:hypothetical protein